MFIIHCCKLQRLIELTVINVCERVKEDVVRSGQNAHTSQESWKKETLKRPTQSSEGTITKFLTPQISREFRIRLHLHC